MERDVVSQRGASDDGSPERFGWSWNHYDQILPDHEEQFRRWTTLLPLASWKDKRILDVGCGIGRNSYWPMIHGAAGGVAIDVDDRTLAVARRNLARFGSLEVRRQSIYDFSDEAAFDIVFSIGVIHHLPDPRAAVQRMRDACRPGGTVLLWVYGYENNEWIVDYFDPLRKALFSRLPIGAVHRLSLLPTAALWAAVRAGVRPTAYLEQLGRFSFDQLRVIVFDQMLPRIAHYWRRDEVLALMQQAGLRDVRLAPVNDVSWCAVGTR
jgi:SAM-dependent methyltransferase